MSRSLIVDQRYRLQAADLVGGPVRVLISAVSFQGVELLEPVLHFRGPVQKHLVLDEAQRRALARLTQSTLCSDWVGRQIELHPTRSQQGAVITITAPPPIQARTGLRRRLPPTRHLPWRTLGLILLLGLTLVVAFWLEQADDPFRLLLELFF